LVRDFLAKMSASLIRFHENIIFINIIYH